MRVSLPPMLACSPICCWLALDSGGAMATGAGNCIAEALCQHGNLAEAESRAYIKQMTVEGRYALDVWG